MPSKLKLGSDNGDARRGSEKTRRGKEGISPEMENVGRVTQPQKAINNRVMTHLHRPWSELQSRRIKGRPSHLADSLLDSLLHPPHRSIPTANDSKSSGQFSYLSLDVLSGKADNTSPPPASNISSSLRPYISKQQHLQDVLPLNRSPATAHRHVVDNYPSTPDVVDTNQSRPRTSSFRYNGIPIRLPPTPTTSFSGDTFPISAPSVPQRQHQQRQPIASSSKPSQAPTDPIQNLYQLFDNYSKMLGTQHDDLPRAPTVAPEDMLQYLNPTPTLPMDASWPPGSTPQADHSPLWGMADSFDDEVPDSDNLYQEPPHVQDEGEIDDSPLVATPMTDMPQEMPQEMYTFKDGEANFNADEFGYLSGVQVADFPYTLLGPLPDNAKIPQVIDPLWDQSYVLPSSVSPSALQQALAPNPAPEPTPAPAPVSAPPVIPAPEIPQKKWTGTRANISVGSLVPLDAPVQQRHYAMPSKTSRREVPAFAKGAKRPRVDDDDDDALTPEQRQKIEAKRQLNTIAARRSRRRKIEHQEALKNQNETLRNLLGQSVGLLLHHHVPGGEDLQRQLMEFDRECL